MTKTISIVNKVSLNPLSKTRTEEGFLINYDVPIARTGIIEYSGHELGRPDLPKVRAFRKPDSFNEKVLKTARLLPVTVDHPIENMVDTKNAKRTVVGATGSDVFMRGIDLIEKEVIIYDKDAIDQIEVMNTKEVSIGLMAKHHFNPGITEDGEEYDCIEEVIRLNHLSVVKEGKAGPRYRLNSKKVETNMTELVKRTVNGVELELARDSAELLDAQLIKNAAEEQNALLNSLSSDMTVLKDQFSAFVNEYKETTMAKGKEAKDETVKSEDKKGVEAKEDQEKMEDKADKDEAKENECANSVELQESGVTETVNSTQDLPKELSEFLTNCYKAAQ
jgi:hypothetical protein